MILHALKKWLKKIKLIRNAARLYHRSRKRLSLLKAHAQVVEPAFSREAPSFQTMADIFKGSWTSAFPDEYGVIAGATRHFDFAVDWRVKWADGILDGGVKGKKILELGPFEAYNTWQLEKLGADSVTCVEGNNLNFLKCLVVKEITGIKARFLYGDFVMFLEQCRERYDIVWASGILYHSSEPLKLLAALAGTTDRMLIYTHYYEEEIISANRFLADNFDPGRNTWAEISGYRAKLHYKNYLETKDNFFSGGVEPHSFWMEKKDILGFLQGQGFNRITFGIDHRENPHGPAMCFLAERAPLI